MGPLHQQVALVTGASRGIGRGIALVLAEQGATVYITGRSKAQEDNFLGGTVFATAEECNERGRESGGSGHAAVVDHADNDAVGALFERIKAEQGRLDILVNNAFQLTDHLLEPDPFFEKPLEDLQMWHCGVTSNYVAAWHAARIMAPQSSGLIVALSGYAGRTYTYGTIFGTAKTAVDRMARDMAIELQPYNVASISLWQGLTLTERARHNLANVADKMTSSITNQTGSSVEHPGRVIAAMATDPEIMARSGGTFITAELGDEYGLTDIDGNRVASARDSRGAPLWQPIGQEPTP
jgi:NAD(P)-dependent dehydrogenase (short-subunit alcohol dehydrogenase family)